MDQDQDTPGTGTPDDGDDNQDDGDAYVELPPKNAARGRSSPGEHASSTPEGFSGILREYADQAREAHARLDAETQTFTPEQELDRARDIIQGLHEYVYDLLHGKRDKTKQQAAQALEHWLQLRGEHYEKHNYHLLDADACMREQIALQARMAVDQGMMPKDQARRFKRWARSDFGEDDDA